MTATKATSTLNESLEVVKARIKEMQDEKSSRAAILVELNGFIQDTSLFSQKQRAIVVREVNKVFKLNTTMSEIKRAIKTVNTAPAEKATPVDSLSGSAKLEVQEPAPAEAQAPAPEAPAEQPEETQPTATVPSTIQEATVMPNVKETLETVSERINVEAPKAPAAKTEDVFASHVQEVQDILAKLGADSEETRAKIVDGFIANYPSIVPTWNLMKGYPNGGHGIAGTLAMFLNMNLENRKMFEAFVTPVLNQVQSAQATVSPVGDLGTVKPELAVDVQVQTPGLSERIMTTVRGKRDSGFSSAFVAAAAAVVGGGLEMVSRGSVSLGAGVGTAVGATGAYFLGGATENLMESETGRYLLAGAIGVAAGGIGSRAGRAVQEEYNNPSAETIALIEKIPGVSVPQQDVPSVGNSAALLSALGL